MSETLLPNNATDAERALDGAAARIISVPTPARDMSNPDAAPVSALPWLAWGVSVDDWQSNWTDRQKREAIKASNAVHRYKGTIGAVRDALAALGYRVDVQEWFRQMPAGAPYTFRLIVAVEQEGVPDGEWQKLLSIVNNAKNLRSHLDAIELVVVSEARPILAAATIMGTEIQVEPGGGNLVLDGSWKLDGTYRLNGLKIPI